MNKTIGDVLYLLSRAGYDVVIGSPSPFQVGFAVVSRETAEVRHRMSLSYKGLSLAPNDDWLRRELNAFYMGVCG